VAEPERIKKISGALLAGEPVRYAADWPIQGTPPAGVMPTDTADCADFALTLTPQGEALHVVPRIAALGIGCKRGTSAEKLEAVFAAFCAEHRLALQGIMQAASIDLKQDEPGLVAFCHARGVKVHVTLNTLVYDRELSGLADAVRAVAAAGAEAGNFILLNGLCP